MDMVGHDNGSVQLISFTVVVKTMIEDGGSRPVREIAHEQFSKRHKHSNAIFLVMRKASAVGVMSV